MKRHEFFSCTLAPVVAPLVGLLSNKSSDNDVLVKEYHDWVSEYVDYHHFYKGPDRFPFYAENGKPYYTYIWTFNDSEQGRMGSLRCFKHTIRCKFEETADSKIGLYWHTIPEIADDSRGIGMKCFFTRFAVADDADIKNSHSGLSLYSWMH